MCIGVLLAAHVIRAVMVMATRSGTGCVLHFVFFSFCVVRGTHAYSSTLGSFAIGCQAGTVVLLYSMCQRRYNWTVVPQLATQMPTR
jgi:hypothetical protein